MNKFMKATIPTKPTAILCGVLQSREFTVGAYAVADVIREVESKQEELEGDEHRMTAELAKGIMSLVEQGGETRAGAVAAVAHWLVITIEGAVPDSDGWRPLEANPAYDGGDMEQPHRLSSFFDVAGTPVSVTPDLLALKWIRKGCLEYREMSVELVRSIGKQISRKRFDKLRAAQVR